VLNIRKLVRNYKETGTLADQCSIFGFVDSSCFITKSGAVGLVLQLQGIDYECLPQQDIDTNTKRLEAAFKLFGPQYRIYQYLFKKHFQPDPPPTYDDLIVNAAEQERHRYLLENSKEMFSIQIYYVLLYQAPTTATKMKLRTALGSFFTQGPDAGMQNLKASFGAKREITLIEEEIDAAVATLRRQAAAFVTHISDFCEVNLLDKNDAFRMLRRLLNLDPERLAHDRLKYDVLTDKYLVGSAIEANRDHLYIDGYHTRILTLREEPAQSWPLILQQLYQVPATYHIVTEWRPVEHNEAIKHIDGMRSHFHKTKRGLSVDNTGDRLQDETKVEFVDDLNECLKEIQKNGNYFGKFTLTIIIYDRDPEKVAKAVSEFRKVFSNQSASLFEETYNQLSAFFATQPGNSHFNFRQLLVTNNNYADWSFLYTLHEGYRWNTYLNREALCVLETDYGTPYFFNLHQHIAGGTTTDDVGHTFATGKTGSGKSFVLNFLTFSLQKYNPRTFIFDLGHSYRNLTRLRKGSYLAVGPTPGEYKINPFSLEPTTDNIEFLFSFIQVLIQGNDNYKITTQDDRNIRQAVEMMFQLEPQIRRLQTLARTLPLQLAERLHKWIEGGQYGHMFDNTQDTITLAHFQCFDFQAMDGFPQLLQPFLFYILHRASSTIYDPATRATLKVFLLDEAWKFFTVPTIREYLINAAKTWRKHNAILILATQSPEDLRESNLLPLLDSLPTKIFLANPDADFDFYTKKFHLNPREVELIQTLIPKRQMLIKTSTMGKKVTLAVDGKSYWLYTSSPKDNELLAAMVQEHGFEQALEILGARRKVQ
jgi:type IV secretion/conjugal transfer VirB4 family ATPase